MYSMTKVRPQCDYSMYAHSVTSVCTPTVWLQYAYSMTTVRPQCDQSTPTLWPHNAYSVTKVGPRCDHSATVSIVSDITDQITAEPTLGSARLVKDALADLAIPTEMDAVSTRRVR